MTKNKLNGSGDKKCCLLCFSLYTTYCKKLNVQREWLHWRLDLQSKDVIVQIFATAVL